MDVSSYYRLRLSSFELGKEEEGREAMQTATEFGDKEALEYFN